MATIRCRCGREFGVNEIPCRHEFHLIPNTGVDALVEKVVQLVEAGEDIGLEVGYAIVSSATAVYLCPFCGRLIVFWDGRDKPPRFYAPE